MRALNYETPVSNLKFLTPIAIEKASPSYNAVEDLADALKSAKSANLRNIAVSGPYGAGKSSVLLTLQQDFQQYSYLPISLATLDPEMDGDDAEESDERDSEGRTEESTERLNRKIEYSILQQLLYREKANTVRHSRFRRINKPELKRYLYCFALFIAALVSFICLFEPSAFYVPSIASFLNFGNVNVVFDFIAVIVLIIVLGLLFWEGVNLLANVRLSKLSLREGGFELSEHASIFNKHLDEILYFFQVTSYDVVIFEDLDRFGTEKIFLKLRELNQLINESKIVDQHVTFVYAVKDDIFKDEHRTKFFDYIVTVIPVINASNSMSKLKQVLKERGLLQDSEISDDDLSEIGFFIEDMRLLTNIVNEFEQYHKGLVGNHTSGLKLSKLLAMITYKNFFPRDFEKLRRRDGVLYQFITSKPQLQAYLTKSIDEKISTFEELIDKKDRETFSKLGEYIEYLGRKTGHSDFVALVIEQEDRSRERYEWGQLEDSETSTDIVEKISKGHKLYITDHYNRINRDLMPDVKRKINRLNIIAQDISKLNKQIKQQKTLRLSIEKLTLSKLIAKIEHQEKRNITEIIDLPSKPLMESFIRRGLIAEDYYDYVSYFYEGDISRSDWQYLLNLKLNKEVSFDHHIDKMKNLVSKLETYMFDCTGIYNLELFNYLASRKSEVHKFTLLIDRLRSDSNSWEVLRNYVRQGEHVGKIFSAVIKGRESETWDKVVSLDAEGEGGTLIQAHLSCVEHLIDEQIQWMNDHYSFMADRFENFDPKRQSEILGECRFNSMNSGNQHFLEKVVEKRCFELNYSNLSLIGRELVNDKKEFNLTQLLKLSEPFSDWLLERIQDVITVIQDDYSKTDSSETIELLLNNPALPIDLKKSYLKGQKEKISDIAVISDDKNKQLAVEENLIEPNWKNVETYYSIKNKLTEELQRFIEMNCDQLSQDVGLTNESLFKSLFNSSVLDIHCYDKLLRVSDYVFEEGINANLEKERLDYLIHAEKVPFTQKNTAVFLGTKALSTYLIHHRKETLKPSFKITIKDPDAISTILNSQELSHYEMYIFSKLMDWSTIISNEELSEQVVKVYCAVDEYEFQPLHIKLISKLQDETKKSFALKLLEQEDKVNGDLCKEILLSIGGVYAEFINDGKAIWVPNGFHRELVKLLRKRLLIDRYNELRGGKVFLRKIKSP